MKVWIDLANSPHPLLFSPIARRLEEAGATVEITARDNAQTVELAERRWDRFHVVGGATPRNRALKVRAIANRMRALRRWARGRRPDVALSHNSYAQAVAARSLGIPVVTAMDFEHQPANHVAFRAAQTILLPEAIASSDVAGQGATPSKVRRYAGLKEEIYLADFEPDPGVLDALGVGRNGAALVVARTPPARATYHRFGNPVFERCLRALAGRGDVQVVVLVRHDEERRMVVALEAPNLITPERAVDSRSLIRAADLMIGAGGTMTREAALLGTPTYSVFAGARPAVDRWLEERGALRTLADPAELAEVPRREEPPPAMGILRERGERLVDVFVEAVVDAAEAER
jgi:uncharacterized protein